MAQVQQQITKSKTKHDVWQGTTTIQIHIINTSMTIGDFSKTYVYREPMVE